MNNKVDFFPIKVSRYEDEEVVIDNWQLGQTIGFKNRITIMNIQKSGSGTSLINAIVEACGQPNTSMVDQLKVGVPECRIFDFEDKRMWVIYGIVPNLSQKGKRIRGKFIMVICNDDEAGSILIERFGIMESLSAQIIERKELQGVNRI